MRTLVAATLLIAAAGAPVPAMPLPSKTFASAARPVSGRVFVRDMTQNDMYEVEAGKIAQVKDVSAGVKTFASKILQAQQGMDQKLKSAASGAGLQAPATMTAAQKAAIAKLKSEDGNAFEKTYVKQQIEAHQSSAMLLMDYARHGNNPALKNFAKESLPVVQQHLTMAQVLQKGRGSL